MNRRTERALAFLIGVLYASSWWVSFTSSLAEGLRGWAFVVAVAGTLLVLRDICGAYIQEE